MQDRDEQIIPSHIPESLKRLEKADQLRRLQQVGESWVDLSSNDYLGLGREKDNKGWTGDQADARNEVAIENPIETNGASTEDSLGNGNVHGVENRLGGENSIGAGGSRLLSGNQPAHEEIETFCADYFRAPSTLLFNSGYMANLGLLSSIARRHDTFIYDEKVHASIKDGIRLSQANRKWSFKHQDLNDLERLLKRAEGEVYVVVEGLYSMDGDHPDLPRLVELIRKYSAWLILDEAHSTGLYGPEGAGLACHYGLEDKIFARIHTFGKAAGWYGAVITGSPLLKDFLINKARTFIYTTALPPSSVHTLRNKLETLRGADAERNRLQEISTLVRKLTDQPADLPLFSPILPIIIPGNTAVKEVARIIRNSKYDVRPILAPTVPAGSERLRVILHSYNSPTEIYAFSTLLMAITEQ